VKKGAKTASLITVFVELKRRKKRRKKALFLLPKKGGFSHL